jgi:hypothetical protein
MPDTPEARFAALAESFHDAPGVTGPSLEPGRRFGDNGLKVRGKIFAMLVDDRLVVKIPRARVDALLASGDGTRFDPGHGRIMKEWLTLDPGSDQDWTTLAREALAFVDRG